jgi:hypothetical protein
MSAPRVCLIRVLRMKSLAGGLLAVFGFASAHAQNGAKLELRLIASVPVPEQFSIAGIDASASGLVALWSLHRPEVLICCHNSLQVIQNEDLARPVAARILNGDSLVEVLDGDNESLFQLSSSGRLISRRHLRVGFEINRAIPGAGGWYVVGQDSTGATIAAFLSDTGDLLRRDILLPQSSGPAPTVQLSRLPAGALATLADPPYTTWTLAAGAPPHIYALSLPRLDTDSVAPNRAPLWVSLPALPVDSGFIRTFSDLRSDQRILVLYDRHGSVLRQTRLDAALGLIASQPERHLLIAVRKVSGSELTFYQWRWEVDHPVGGRTK